MVNWQNPANIELQYFGVVKVEYFVWGIFTWEVLSTLYFDWQVITGKRLFRWPFLLYVGSRFMTVLYLVSASVGFSIMSRFDCEVWIVLLYGSAYLAVSLASALLALRTIAFWNNHKVVVGVAILLYVSNFAFLIYGVTQGRSVWDTETDACIGINTIRNLGNFVVTFGADLILFIIMLSGIWRRRKAGALWKLVYRQGMLWVAGAAMGELPCIILTLFNFNNAMNLLLSPFSPLATSLFATRMYRELCEYATPVARTQYHTLSIDVSPMKVEPSKLPVITDLTSISQEFGKHSSGQMI